MAIVCLALGSALPLLAQTDLTGKTYYHPNIMADELNKAMSQVKLEIDSLREDALAKAEAKKGSKLTESEIKELNDRLEEGRKMMEAVKKAVTTAITVEFTSPKDAVVRIHMAIDDNALKLAGVSWMKRKAVKMALAIMPEKHKATYEVKDRMVIFDDGEEKDTMRLSQDNKFLSGTFDGKTPFKLTRK